MNKTPNSAADQKVANLDPTDVVTNQQSVPSTWWCGTRLIPLAWIMPVVNRFTQPAPGGGKKGSGGGGKGGKGGGGGSASLNHFGTIAGEIGCGPVAFISGYVQDDALVWPDAPQWPSGRHPMRSLKLVRAGGVAGCQWAAAHGCKVGDNVSITGFDDDSLNKLSVAVQAPLDAYSFSWAAAGSDIPYGPNGSGSFTKVEAIVAGDVRRIGAQIYQATADHTPSPANQPPGGPWRQYRLGRTDVGVTNPQKITVVSDGKTHGGDIYIYWGTADQELDTVNEQTLAEQGHPNGRNFASAVEKDYLFGTGRTQPHNSQVIAGRLPQQTVITGDAADFDADGNVNPFCALAELLTSPLFGVPAVLDADTWQAAADWALEHSDITYISPLLTEQSAIRSVAADILAHCDGWVAFDEVAAIVAGHWPHNEAPPVFTDDTIVDFNDVLNAEEIGWESDLWDGTANQVIVNYADAQRAFKTLPAIAGNSWNLEASGRPKTDSIDLKHVTRVAQALAISHQMAKLRGELTFSGTLKLRREKVVNIRRGSLFLLTDDQVGVSKICRCIEATISAPPAGRTEISFTTEPGYTSTPYRPTPGVNLGTELPRPTLPLHYQLVQLPHSLTGEDFAAAVLCSREDVVTSRLDVWFQQADSTAFYELATLTHFAVSGQVNATFAPFAGVEDDAHPVEILLDDHTPQPDLDHVASTQTDDAINDNALLLFLFKAASPGHFEILTVKELTAAGAGVYNAKVRRARYGTLQGGDGSYSFDAGDTAFLIYRDELVTFEHAQFAAFASAGTATTFRLVPSTAWIEGDVADVYDGSTNAGGVTAEVAFTFADPFAPTITFISLTQGGLAVSFATSYATTDAFAIEVRFGSSLGDMATGTVKARLGGTDVVLWSGVLPAGATSALVTPSVPFTLAEGDWRILASIQTSAGRGTAATLQDSGSDALLQVRAAGSTVTLAPTITPNGFFGNYSTKTTGLACATPGATIHYQIATLGQAAGGSWTTYGGTFPVGRNKTVYAYASASGLSDSAVVSADFEYDTGL